MPTLERFINYIKDIINLNYNKKYIYAYYNYLDYSEFNNSFEERVASILNGYLVEINHSYYKPIHFDGFYILLDWSIYRNDNGNYVGDIVIHCYNNYNDLMRKLNE